MRACEACVDSVASSVLQDPSIRPGMAFVVRRLKQLAEDQKVGPKRGYSTEPLLALEPPIRFFYSTR